MQKCVLPYRHPIYKISREYQVIQTIGMNLLGPIHIGLQDYLFSMRHGKVRHNLDTLSFVFTC
jgi:hypothetical protein